MTRSTPTPRLLPPSAGDIQFDLLAPRQWRVRDARDPKTDANAIRGIVGVVAGLCEVVRITAPVEIGYCRDLEAARRCFTRRSAAADTQSVRSGRDRG